MPTGRIYFLLVKAFLALSVALPGFAYAKIFQNIGENGCYREAKSHFYYNGAVPVGAAYISRQSDFFYLVIDNGGKKEAKQALVASLEAYLKSSTIFHNAKCGDIARCGGGKSSVCVLKIDSAGELLPVGDAETIAVGKNPSSSVIWYSDSKKLRIMSSKDIYESLTSLPQRELGPGRDLLSYSVKKAAYISCSKVVRPEGSIEEYCELQL